MPAPDHGVLLLWGLPSTSVPVSVAEAVARCTVRLERVSTPHAAAAQLIGLGADARAILVDPAVLTPSAAGMLAMLQRYALVPIIALPAPGSRTPPRTLPGVLAWEQAASIVARFLQPAAESPHVRSANADGDSPEKTVTSSAGKRYDDLDAQPLLSEQELRALLGSPE